MSDALKLAMRISAVDLFSTVLRRFHRQVEGTGAAARSAQRDYDRMITHASAGLKSLAVGAYAYDKLKPAVKASAELQESLLSVKQLLSGAHPDAKLLADQMARVRANSIAVASHMKYSAVELTDVTHELLQGGVDLNAVLGKRGAAFSVEALAEVSGQDPAQMAEDIAKIGNAFELQGKQYGEAANSIAQVSIASSAGIGELLYNLKQAAPAAQALRIPLKDTAAALGTTATLGAEAGSNLRAFFRGLSGTTPRAQKMMRALHVKFFDKGQFVGLETAIQRLRKAMSGLNEQQKMIALNRIFQRGGSQTALLLMQQGSASFENIKKEAAAQASLQQQMHIWETGFNASLSELGSTNKTTLANLFDPMLNSLTKAVKLTNQLSGAIGNLASQHRGIADAASIGGAAVVGGAGAYGIYRLLRAVGPGRRFLKGVLGKVGGVAAGVAEGKAVQAATGVVPVFVTNWPSVGGIGGGIGGGAAKNAEGAAEGAGAVSVGRRIATRAAALGTGFAALGGGGLAGAAIAGGGVALAGGGGYLVGHEISKHLIEPNRSLSDKIGGTIATALAFFGDKTAQDALDQHFKYMSSQPSQKVGGTVHIEIDQANRAHVTSVQSANPLVPLEVGRMMVIP